MLLFSKKKNTNALKRVGILIPTFNRSEYLQRSLLYLDTFFDRNYYEILVLDGSSEVAHANKNKELCLKYDVRYAFYPQEEYTAYQKIHDGLCNLGTEYFQLLGDDDFLNSFAIKRCVAHLDDHSDCVGAFGQYVQFNIKQDKSKLIVRRLTTRSKCSYEQDCPFDRLFWGMVEMPITVYYAVKRTKTEIATLSSVIEFDCGECDFLIGDPLVSSLTLLKGKLANINLPYLCRQTGQSLPREPVVAGQEMLMPNKNFADRYSRARTIMLNHVSESVDRELAGKAIDAALGAFLGGFCLSPSRMNNQLKKLTQQMSSGVTDKGPLKIHDSLPTPSNDDSFARIQVKSEFAGKANSNQHNFTCSVTPNMVDLLKEYDFSIPFISKYHQLTQLTIKDDRGIYWLGALEPRTVVC